MSHHHPSHRDQASPQLSTADILGEIQSELKKGGTDSSAFVSFPKHVSFETQEAQEKIILLLRRHMITNVPWMVLTLLMSFLPALFSGVTIFSLLPVSYQFMTVIVWYLIVLAFILENFLSWYFNVYIVTDERLIDVDFFSLVYKKISETKIDRIQDVSYVQGGFVQSFFNYGTVSIQTAGEMREFEFDKVPQPAKVVKILNQLLMQEEQEQIEGRVR